MTLWRCLSGTAEGSSVARAAIIIGHAVDVWDGAWAIREARPTELGFDVLFGWPDEERRGRGGAGGPRVIVSAPLAAYMETIRSAPGAHRLPIGNTSVRRIRRLLGHHRQIDRAAWWEERADDLCDLTITEFAAKHAVSVGAVVNARHALLGPTLRPARWWRAEDIAALLLRGAPISSIADDLDLSAGSVRRLRAKLRGP